MKKRICEFEEQRLADLDVKRDELKSRPLAAMHYNYESGKLTCPLCAREFAAKIGYIRHLRVHQRQALKEIEVVAMAEIGQIIISEGV